MSERPTPKEMAEILIESAGLQNHIGFHYDINPSNLTNMAMLDFGALDPNKYGADYFSGSDLSSSLASAIVEAENEASVKQILHLSKTDEAAAMVIQGVDAVLDEEFRQADVGSITPELWQGYSTYQRAGAMALHRAIKGVFQVPRPADYKNNYSKYEYKAYVRMLKGGHSGMTTMTRLFFNYNVPFHIFLKALENETQLCVIPPLPNKLWASTKDEWAEIHAKATTPKPHTKVGPPTLRLKLVIRKPCDIPELSAKSTAPSPNAKEITATAEPRAKTGTLEGSSFDESVQSNSGISSISIPPTPSTAVTTPGSGSLSDGLKALLEEPDPVMETQKIKLIKSRPKQRTTGLEIPGDRVSGDTGYTLADGPWSYYILRKEDGFKGDWTQLATVQEYEEMVESIRRSVEQNPQDETQVILMHSMDRAAYEEWKEINFLEIDERNRPWISTTSAGKSERARTDNEDVDDDDDVEGVPYFQWLMKSLAEKKGGKGASP